MSELQPNLTDINNAYAHEIETVMNNKTVYAAYNVLDNFVGPPHESKSLAMTEIYNANSADERTPYILVQADVSWYVKDSL